MQTIQVGSMTIGPGAPLAIIAGPCMAESLELCLEIGQTLKQTCQRLGLSYIFKASFDKANRSSIASYRGPGLEQGLAWLGEVGRQLNVPVTTDIHEPHQAAPVAEVADLLQIPAFLCRQTDLLAAAAKTGRPINVKKGQFLAPEQMKNVADKLVEGYALAKPAPARPHIMLTERGTFFGYNRLVNDFLGLGDMMQLGWPVCFDVTHSTQIPGGGEGGKATGGRPDRAPLLARCAVAAGVDALFIETHPEPSRGRSDAATMLPLAGMDRLLSQLAAIRSCL